MTTLDEMLAELSQVLIALGDEPDTETRVELEARRDRLRDTLRSVDIDQQRPTAELLEEHSRLEARLKKARLLGRGESRMSILPVCRSIAPLPLTRMWGVST